MNVSKTKMAKQGTPASITTQRSTVRYPWPETAQGEFPFKKLQQRSGTKPWRITAQKGKGEQLHFAALSHSWRALAGDPKINKTQCKLTACFGAGDALVSPASRCDVC